jgi:hypothetical protein
MEISLSREQRHVLQTTLKQSAVRLGRKHTLDPSSVQRFVQSEFQEEINRSIIKQFRRGAWERSIIVCNNSNFSDAKSHFSENTDEILLGRLSKQLYTSVPYENKVLPKVHMLNH